MINVYPAVATDFSTLGVTTLEPASCTIEERAGGLFELEMTHPIDADLKWTYLQTGNIIKAPCAIREAPMLRVSDNISGGSSTKTRAIYKVTTDGRRLRLRAQPNESAKVLHAYKPGTEVVRLSVSGNWASIIVCSNGQSGYMWAANLEFVRNETETVAADEEKPSAVVETQQTREQLFRIYSVAPDSASGMVTVKASHVFYDLKGIVCTKEYAPENIAANEVLATILANLSATHGFTFHCPVTASISGDYSGVSVVRALLDPEIGIVPLTHAQIIRDNYDVYILPDTPMERGMEIRHRKNLIGAVLTTDASNVVTRIRPVGKDKDGNRLFITDNGGWVESANKALYPTSLDTEIEYDVTVSTDKDSKFKTEAEARAELKRLAEADFANGADAETVSLEVEFAALENTEEYEAYAKMQRLFLYDQVRVIAAYAGINAKLRVNGYVFDCLLRRYDDVYVGDISSLEQVTYGYEIASGTVSGTKLLPNSVNANTVMRRATIGYAKIAQAAIDQLSADSLTAQIAHINALTAGTIDADKLTAAWAKLYTIVAEKITAGEVTADTLTAVMAKLTKASVEYAEINWAQIANLTAAIAKIAKAQITKANIEEANIDWAEIKNLTAAIADIANANIGTAKIDWAKIYDLTADTAIITEGVGGKLYIARLAVTEANMTSLTVGELMVKAADGSFKRLTVGADGNVSAETVQVEGDNVANATISGGKLIENTITARELNVESIFADKALIRAIKAANIDVSDLFAAEATISALDSWLIRASTITALEGKLDVWASEKITLAVKNVQIGGTNLLHHSGDMSASDGVGFHYDSSGADSMGTAVRQDDGSMLVTNSASNLRFVHSRLAAAAGEVYTVSAEYKDVSGACPHQFQMLSSSDTNDMIQNAVSEGDKTTLANGWVRSVFTFVIPEGATYVTPFFRSGTDYTLYTHQYYIRRPKLERGNKATDWSPNPADMEARMSEAESTITQQADEIAARVTQTTYNAGMAGKANASDLNALSERVSTAETSIVQNANSITSKASQSDVNALGERVTTAESEIRQTPSKISAAVNGMQVGGTNLVTLGNQSLVNAGGSAAEYIGKDWYRESEHQTTISPYSGVCWLQCPGVLITAGRKYTLSYYAWIQPGAAAGAVKFRPNLFGATSDTDKYPTGFIPFVIGTPTKYAVTFDTTGWATGTYTLRFVMMEGQTHEVYFTDIKLEEGDKATAWSPNPNEVRIGSSILMDVNHTEISTPYLDIDVSGTDGDMHIDENGISADTATFKVVNCPDLVKVAGGTTYTGGLQEAFDALNGRFLTGDVTISLSADQYGTFVLKGVYGVAASVSIVGNGHSINGALTVYNCKLVNINIGGVTINGNGSSTPLALIDAGFVSVSGVTINGGGAGTAVDVNYGTRLMMYNNGLYNAGNLIRLGHCTEGSLVQLRGGTCTNYLRADGARWTMSGTRPDGTYAQENTCLHAPENPDSLTIDYGTSQPPVTPVTTESFTANVTGTYYPSGHWINDNTIRQGHEGTGSNGRKDYGCMWFGAGVLSGKTVKSATLTIKRIAGKGRSSSVTMKLWSTALTGKSGKPTDSLVSLGEVGKIGNGETVTVNVPVSAISVIAAGGGLVLYTEETANASGKTYSANYAHFEGVGGNAPVLTVTYQ